jgi:hypothetical protein
VVVKHKLAVSANLCQKSQKTLFSKGEALGYEQPKQVRFRVGRIVSSSSYMIKIIQLELEMIANANPNVCLWRAIFFGGDERLEMR